jgi:hypothetical protein
MIKNKIVTLYKPIHACLRVPDEPSARPAQRGSIAQSEASAAPKLRRVERPAHKEGDQEGQQLTEAEIAMLEAKKRHEAEQEAKMADSEERRKAELQKVEQELEVLKQRQIERKKEREVEEREFAERRKQVVFISRTNNIDCFRTTSAGILRMFYYKYRHETFRRKEEEIRKTRIEEQKRIKEEVNHIGIIFNIKF